MAQLIKPAASVAEQSFVEEQADGTVVVRHHVREWQPQAAETLREIEATIDSWGQRPGAAPAVAAAPLDLEKVQENVDRLTRRVKDRRKEVVTEVVTEWVEGPVGSGPINVEEPQQAEADEAGKVGEKERSRPKRRFSWFRPKEDAEAEPGPKRKDG